MTAIGPSPSEQGVLGFLDTDPLTSVVVDVAFVADALVPERRYHREASAFLRKLTGEATVVSFTELLELRLHDVAAGHRDASGRGRQVVPRTERRRGHLVAVEEPPADLFDSWRAFLAAAEAAYCVLEDVLVAVWPVMELTGLSAERAVDVSLLREVGADALVTTDPVFGSVRADLLPLRVPDSMVDDVRTRRSTIGG